MERICQNCKLFDPHESTCSVRIIYGTEVVRNVPVEGNSSCLWEELGLSDHIKEVRFWVEDEAGNSTSGNGTVKIEYPDGFFGQGDAC